ncbi:hypothetical protein Tco_0358847 [Tanacetum coccineum]
MHNENLPIYPDIDIGRTPKVWRQVLYLPLCTQKSHYVKDKADALALMYQSELTMSLQEPLLNMDTGDSSHLAEETGFSYAVQQVLSLYALPTCSTLYCFCEPFLRFVSGYLLPWSSYSCFYYAQLTAYMMMFGLDAMYFVVPLGIIVCALVILPVVPWSAKATVTLSSSSAEDPRAGIVVLLMLLLRLRGYEICY